MFNILIVEDDRNQRRLIAAALKQSGYHALTAENGEEALNMLDSEQVDLIITDIMMPQMDGLETLQLIKRMKNYPSERAVIIALTANAFAGAKASFPPD